jgi:formylglycine-generating enzyme required for sulfatase activity
LISILLVVDVAVLVQVAEGQLERLKKFKREPAGPVVETTMVEIPAGPFWMGRDGMEALEDERPRHQVTLDSYWMDAHEVTTAQYAKFLATTNRAAPWLWELVELVRHGDRPVIGVDWFDAAGYCEWVGKRLPTEAEWEKAARGTDERLYPWGNAKPTAALANFALGARFSYDQVLMPVGTYKQAASPYGLTEMAGNVWEWVQDWYAGNFYENAPPHDPKGPEQGQFKVLRGGSWSDLPKYLLTYGRFKLPPGTRNSYTGFRCAKSVKSEQ